jgi:hypothetical protein
MNSRLDIVLLPSHTFHALQPLDVSYFKPFKSAFRQIRDSWTVVNKGRKVEKQDLCEWTSQALQKALSSKNIISEFRKTGIWPLNAEAVRTQMLLSEGFEEGQEGFHPSEEGYNSSDNSDEGTHLHEDQLPRQGLGSEQGLMSQQGCRSEQGLGSSDLGLSSSDLGPGSLDLGCRSVDYNQGSLAQGPRSD